MIVNNDKYCSTCDGDLDKICYFCAYDKTMILSYDDIRQKYKLTKTQLKTLKSSTINVDPNNHIESKIQIFYAEDVEKLVLEKCCKLGSKLYGEIIRSLENRPKRKERYMQIRKELVDLVNKIEDELLYKFSLGDYNVYICDNYLEDEDVFVIAKQAYDSMKNEAIKSRSLSKAQDMLSVVLREKFSAYADKLICCKVYNNVLQNYNNEELMSEFLSNDNNFEDFRDQIEIYKKFDKFDEYIKNHPIQVNICPKIINLRKSYCRGIEEITFEYCKTFIDRQIIENKKKN